ncbi:MAG TPA: hypothetical protein VJS92_00460 [Candidatus Polarisedimenticolaceae bacterium]|nr:hypothetical protein [Candidatus Polarisedimenticolaceae bacterium]
MNESCALTREAFQRRLDGDVLTDELERGLDEHREACAACREFEAELRAMQRSLRSLPLPAMPDELLAAVWARTSRAPRRFWQWADWSLQWRAAAAAVALAGLLLFVWIGTPRPAPPSAREIREGAEQARRVFALTARALRRTEDAAVQKVLVDRVSPSLSRVPIRWPEPARRKLAT